MLTHWKRTMLAAALVFGLTSTGFAQFNLGGHDFTPSCLPCHNGPDWNHTMSSATYTVTTTTLSLIGDPTGDSAKCLSCHDGTLDRGDYGGSPDTGQGKLTGNDSLGTDLTNHHPVSFTYDTLLVNAHEALRSVNSVAGYLKDGELQCTSCHDQHNIGTQKGLFAQGYPLCMTCHLGGSETEAAGILGKHHIPGRDNPWPSNDSEGQTNGDFKCTLCHQATMGDPGGFCANCHQPFASPDAPPTGHHGGDRYDPLANCADCHGATLQGKDFLDNNNNLILSTPACNGSCHGSNVYTGVPSVVTGGPYTGYYDQAVSFDAGLTTDKDTNGNDTTSSLSYEWVFGDGTAPVFPAIGVPTAAHTYAFDSNLTYPHTYTGYLTVTDGVSEPVVKPFSVIIDVPPGLPGAEDIWAISVPATSSRFDLTIDKKGVAGAAADGTFVAVKQDGGTTSLAMGIEFTGVIFWMDVDLQVTGWSVGDTYFGNIDRTKGTMSGVVYAGTSINAFSGVVGAVGSQ